MLDSIGKALGGVVGAVSPEDSPLSPTALLDKAFGAADAVIPGDQGSSSTSKKDEQKASEQAAHARFMSTMKSCQSNNEKAQKSTWVESTASKAW